MKLFYLLYIIFIFLSSTYYAIDILKINPPSAVYNENVTLLLTVSDSSEYNESIKIQINLSQLKNCIVFASSNNSIICSVNFTEYDIGINLPVYADNILQNINFTVYDEIFSNVSLVYRMYYNSIYEQLINLRVNSYNLLNEKKITLKSNDSDVINLYDCYIDYDYENYIYCYGTIEEIGLYYVYVDGEIQIYDNDYVTMLVMSHPTQIENVKNIEPTSCLVSVNQRTLTLKVDYVINIDSASFSLVEEDLGYSVTLTNCQAEKDSNTEILCKTYLNNPGDYSVYLNGVNQKIHLFVYVDSLTTAYDINPDSIKYTGTENIKDFVVKFDSSRYYSTKTIELKGENTNIELKLNYIETIDYIFIRYTAAFKEIDRYYLYIEGIKQGNASILYSDEPITSIIYDILPKKVLSHDLIYYTLFVDTNFGISDLDIKLVKDYLEFHFSDCKADKNNSSIVYCYCFINYVGNITLDLYLGSLNQNLQIESKEMTIITGLSPNSFLASKYKKGLSLIFSKNVSEYRNQIKVSSDRINFIDLYCRIAEDSYDKRIICSIKLVNPGVYYFYVNGYACEEYLVAYTIKEDSMNSNFLENYYFLFIILMIILT
jgi:hypothetical protein